MAVLPASGPKVPGPPYDPYREIPGMDVTQYRPGAIYPDTYQPPAPPEPPVEGDGYVTQDGDHLVTSPGGDWLHTEGT